MKGFECQSGTFLLWETIKQYKTLGANRFNFGGCGINSINKTSSEYGVYCYKNAFGSTIIKCTSGQKILRPFTYRIVKKIKSYT